MTRARAWAWCARLVAVAAVVSTGAFAQPQDYGSDVDPPVRVGRLSNLEGQASFSPAGSEEWVVASINRPIVTGDRLWSDANSSIELATDNSTWWLGDQTSVTVSNLDDRIVQMQVREGVLDAQVQRIPAGYIVEIDTPNLAFSVTRPGRYRIEVDPQEGSTLVAVRNGQGEVYGETASYVITSQQAYRFYGTDISDSEFVSLPPPDAFDRFVDQRARRYAAAPRYVSPDVIGYEDLDQYGSWTVESTFGNVWFPRSTPVDWAPYRNGHWSWIDPWGWTWVDDAPWGFAPFHYGRWAYFNRGWGWVPGPKTVRAVYAPALVAFVGGSGFSIAVSSGPAIGWFPLAPHEVYVPPYRVTRNYFRQVNVSNTVINVTNVTNIYNNPARISQLTYANRRVTNAVTAVPPAAFAQAQNVARVAVPVAPAAVQRAEVHSVVAVAPARPALLGAGPAARAKPPAAAMQRAVVAKVPPPPPPVPDAQKIQALEKNPGRPLTQTQLQTLRRAAPPAAAAPAPVRVVEQPKPAPNAAPPANAGPRGAERRAAPPNVPAAGAGAATPPTAPSQRRGPPSAIERSVTRPPEAQGPQGQPGAAPRPPEARAPQAGPSAVPRPPEARLKQGGAEGPAPSVAPPGQANRPAPQLHPGPRPPEARPQLAPEPRAAPRPPEAGSPGAAEGRAPSSGPPGQASRPAPQLHPAPRPPEARPQLAPEPRAAPRPPEAAPPGQANRPPPQLHPAPRAPEARPQPAPEPRAAPRPPEARPQPAPEPRAAPRPPQQLHPQPAPEPRGGPPPQAQGRPQPAPPAAHGPAQRPTPPGQEKGKEKENDRKDQNG